MTHAIPIFLAAISLAISGGTFLLNRYTAQVTGRPRESRVALVFAIVAFALCATAVVIGLVAISGGL